MRRLLPVVSFTFGWMLGAVPTAFPATPASPPAETEMEKTVVTATRTSISLKDAPGAVTVITADEIKDLPVRDITDILRQAAGVTLIGRGAGGRKTISIRGTENRHVLSLIDGKRIAASNATMGHSDFENMWVPVESIERVEIVRGPLSSLYGSEALGGVVNIITRPPTQTWRGGFNAGAGGLDDDNGGDARDYGAYVSGPIAEERIGISLATAYRKNDPVTDPEDEKLYDIEGQEVRSLNAKITFTPGPDHRFELYADIIDEERELRSIDSRSRYYETVYELDKHLIGLGWHGTIGPAQSKINIYQSKIDKLSTKTMDASGSTSETPDTVTNDVLDAQTSFALGGNLFTLGGEYRLETLAAESLEGIGGEDEATHTALFLQNEVEISGRLLLTPGLRWDEHEFSGSEFSPRIYALYRLTERINLKAGYGRAFNAPTIKQVSPGYSAQTGPHHFLGNPDVKPETSDNYEAGVEYFGSRVTAKVFYFHSDIDDLIRWNRIGVDGSTRIFEADNLDSARTRGVETEFGVTLPYGLHLSSGYTYLDARDTGNDRELEGRPEHTINAKLKYSLPSLGLNAILRYQYIGEQVFENDNDELEGVPAYFLWHAAVHKTLLEKTAIKVDLHLGVENIGDVRLADKSDLYLNEERGRFFYAKLSASL